jgi:hypothetical protein
MRRERTGAVRLLWPALAAALIALWPPPAAAGHGGHRSQHLGARDLHLARHLHRIGPAGKPGAGHRTPPPAPPRSVPTRSRPS